MYIPRTTVVVYKMLECLPEWIHFEHLTVFIGVCLTYLMHTYLYKQYLKLTACEHCQDTSDQYSYTS